MKTSKKLIIALAFPIVFLLGMVAKNEFDIRTSERVVLDIEGYDPRDLLRGHYIVFRYKWDFDRDKMEAYEQKRKQKLNDEKASFLSLSDNSLCLMENKKVYVLYEEDMARDGLKDCKHVLSGKFYRGFENSYGFSLGLEKFYVPEQYARIIEQEFLKYGGGQVIVALNSQHKVILLDLLINGKSWRELVREPAI